MSHLGPVGSRWASCWPHEPCYQGHGVIADLFANALNDSHRIDWYFVYLSRHLTDGRGTAMLRVMKGDERSAEKPCNEQNSTSAACHWIESKYKIYRWCSLCDTRDPFYCYGLTLIPAWINNHMLSKMWNEITYPYWDYSWSMLVKGAAAVRHLLYQRTLPDVSPLSAYGQLYLLWKKERNIMRFSPLPIDARFISHWYCKTNDPL